MLPAHLSVGLRHSVASRAFRWEPHRRWTAKLRASGIPICLGTTDALGMEQMKTAAVPMTESPHQVGAERFRIPAGSLATLPRKIHVRALGVHG